MPIDLLIANAVVVAISLGLFLVAVRPRLISHRAALLLAGFCVVVLLMHALWLADNLVLARVLPVADVIAWANLQTPATALLAGLSWRLMPGARWQRVLAVAALAGVGAYRLAGPYLGKFPAIGPQRWANGVCRQSTTSTCSAAAAATLLGRHGIGASEAEMARLCLTHADGTSMLGLYRGLKIKTARTAWTVRVISVYAILDGGSLPAIISISDPGLPRGLLGIGNRHSVVLLSIGSDGEAQIADPFSGGVQSWRASVVSAVIQGDGLALVRRR